MKIKKSGGYIVHQQLEFAFAMLQLGGSPTQYYNTVDKVYEPDRTLTPYLLKPNLQIYDPEGNIPSGEYSSAMTNVIWTLTLCYDNKTLALTKGKDYTIGDDNSLTLTRNVAANESLQINFSADYLDKYRQQTSHFKWDITLSTVAKTELNFSLKIDAPSKLNLSPLKDRGKFQISSQAINGSDNIQDSDIDYLWEIFDYTAENFRSITDDDLWYITGSNSKTITVDQAYINKVLLRITAILKSNTSVRDAKTVLLRRYYGAYESTVEFSNGKYLYKDTKTIFVEAHVCNRQGIITDPSRFFDMELLYHNNPNSRWKSLGYGEFASTSRDDETEDHEVGIMLRELSALLPVSIDGKIITVNGKCLVGQFPTSEREVD